MARTSPGRTGAAGARRRSTRSRRGGCCGRAWRRRTAWRSTRARQSAGRSSATGRRTACGIDSRRTSAGAAAALFLRQRDARVAGRGAPRRQQARGQRDGEEERRPRRRTTARRWARRRRAASASARPAPSESAVPSARPAAVAARPCRPPAAAIAPARAEGGADAELAPAQRHRVRQKRRQRPIAASVSARPANTAMTMAKKRGDAIDVDRRPASVPIVWTAARRDPRCGRCRATPGRATADRHRCESPARSRRRSADRGRRAGRSRRAARTAARLGRMSRTTPAIVDAGACRPRW